MKIPCARCKKNSTTLTHVVFNGTMYLIPACDGHAAETLKEQSEMEAAGGIFDKYDVKNILEVIAAEDVPQKHIEEEGEVSLPDSSPGWFFSDRPGHWIDIKGNDVPISSLSKKEFIDAALALTKANFARVTERFAWTKKLEPEGTPIVYPRKELDVGKRIAGEKLDDFKEVAERKGWV